MVPLYSPEEVKRLEGRSRRARSLALGIAAVCLAACVALCTRVRTGNAAQMLSWVVDVSTAGGWAVILLHRLRWRPDRIVAAHMDGVLKNPEEALVCGELHLVPGLISIPGSIDIRKAEVTDGEDRVSVKVLAEKTALLPPEGTRVRLRTVRGYIVACEVAS